jgi:hypothetical protein
LEIANVASDPAVRAIGVDPSPQLWTSWNSDVVLCCVVAGLMVVNLVVWPGGASLSWLAQRGRLGDRLPQLCPGHRSHHQLDILENRHQLRKPQGVRIKISPHP